MVQPFALVFWENELFFLKVLKGTRWEVPVGSSKVAPFSQRRGITPAARRRMLAEHLDLCQPPAPAAPLLPVSSQSDELHRDLAERPSQTPI